MEPIDALIMAHFHIAESFNETVDTASMAKDTEFTETELDNRILELQEMGLLAGCLKMVFLDTVVN